MARERAKANGGFGVDVGCLDAGQELCRVSQYIQSIPDF